jgi:hypothetical protein
MSKRSQKRSPAEHAAPLAVPVLQEGTERLGYKNYLRYFPPEGGLGRRSR